MEKYVDSSTSALSPPTVSVKSGMLAFMAGQGGVTTTLKSCVTGSQSALLTVTMTFPVCPGPTGLTITVLPLLLTSATLRFGLKTE